VEDVVDLADIKRRNRMARAYRAISGDSHLDMSPERWTPRVPARWRDRAPKLVKLPNGGDAIIIEGRGPMTPGLAITGKPFQEHTPELAHFDGSSGTGPPEQRLREQDQDGVDAEILFTHPSYPNHWRGIRENEPYLAMIRAYNEFLLLDYAAVAPDRLFPMAVIPDCGVDDAVAEMEYCAKMGYKGVNLHMFPSGKGYPTPEDDKFWAAAVDLKIGVCSHTVGGSTRFGREGQVFQYKTRPKGLEGRDPVNLVIRFAGENAMAPLQMAFAGVFERFPTLKMYWSETQIGWLPYTLSQIDDTYERNRYWAKRLFDLDYLERLPSEYLRAQTWGFINDPLGIELRDRIGVDKLIWGNDFAHAASDWPNSQRALAEMFVGVPEDEQYAMLVGNTARFFGIEVERPAKVGAAAS
jgi:predicted TIM-barrel fold metal-dependent hydrolase